MHLYSHTNACQWYCTYKYDDIDHASISPAEEFANRFNYYPGLTGDVDGKRPTGRQTDARKDNTTTSSVSSRAGDSSSANANNKSSRQSSGRGLFGSNGKHNTGHWKEGKGHNLKDLAPFTAKHLTTLKRRHAEETAMFYEKACREYVRVNHKHRFLEEVRKNASESKITWEYVYTSIIDKAAIEREESNRGGVGRFTYAYIRTCVQVNICAYV